MKILVWTSKVPTSQSWRRLSAFEDSALRTSNLRDALATALRYSGPAIVDVVTNPNALALPPKIDAKEVAGYGLYVAKQTLHGRLFESIDELKGNLP